MVQDNNGHNNGQNHDESADSDSNIIRFSPPPKQKTQPPHNASDHGGAAINLPPMTKTLMLVFIAVQLVMSLALSDPAQYWMMMHFGFVPAYYTGQAGLIWPMIAGPITYMFVHGGWMHAGLNTIMTMAFGAGCERVIGGKRMLILFILCGLASVGLHLAFNWGSTDPVIGASGGISGLFAAMMMVLYKTNPNGFGGRYGLWPFIVLWLIISVAFGMMGGPGGSSIAWIAHIGGFISGFLFFPLVMKIKP